MSVRLRESLTSVIGQLRHEPCAKRVRASLGGVTVVDTTSAVLVWEPRRVTPTYAVPLAELTADVAPGGGRARAGDVDEVGYRMPDVAHRPVLDPSIPFGVHTADGEVLDVSAGGAVRRGAAFGLSDPDLAGYVMLDFAVFDGWMEEDEPIVSHPRDPFHRIDVLASSRRVRLELEGELLADTSRPVLLFETMLPVRYYLPRADVRADLVASSTRTFCAYKGQASYWSMDVAGRTVPDLAWTYRSPLHEAGRVRDLVAFFDERVDVTLDDVALDRPVTPWSGSRFGAGRPHDEAPPA